MHIGRILTALGINAIPAFGWLFGDWSAGTILAVYWFENLAICLFLGIQILVHRKFNRLRGHFDYSAPPDDKSTAPTYFLFYFPRALIFILAHAVFLGLLLVLIFPKNFGPSAAINLDNFKTGACTELGLLFLSFLVGIPRLLKSPFRWIEEEGIRSFGRIILVQLVIIGGMFLTFSTNSPAGLFGLFMILKTLTDLGSCVPQYKPKEAPKWLARLMDKVPAKDGRKETFSEYWRQTDDAEAVRQRRNEEIYRS